MVPEEVIYDIIKDILITVLGKEAAEQGMPRTKEYFFRTMSLICLMVVIHCLLPKKMAWRTCLTELTWFLKEILILNTLLKTVVISGLMMHINGILSC